MWMIVASLLRKQRLYHALGRNVSGVETRWAWATREDLSVGEHQETNGHVQEHCVLHDSQSGLAKFCPIPRGSSVVTQDYKASRLSLVTEVLVCPVHEEHLEESCEVEGWHSSWKQHRHEECSQDDSVALFDRKFFTRVHLLILLL